MALVDDVIALAFGMGMDPDWLRTSLAPAIEEEGGEYLDGHPVPYAATVVLEGERRYVYADGTVERPGD